jgi:DNA-binding transcriptional MocR family regulator
MKRYEALAADIAASIRNRLLKPGDRLPSVREASASRKLSPATVFEAYYLLEAQGLVHSRPRSGYYVSERPRALPAEPQAASTPDGEARPVEISAMVTDMLRSAMSREVVPLGSAFPSPLLFPLERLGRVLAKTATQLDPWSTVDELTPGHLELRRQIALRYSLDGVQLDPDEILVTNGAMEALNLCLSAVCRPGDAVVVESPCFYVCLQALERLGLRAIEVATDPREGIDLAALENAITRHAPKACWVMTNFQNPLGSAMPVAKKRALVELVTRHRLPLIEDDVYQELFYDKQRPAHTKAFDREGWVLHCSSFPRRSRPAIAWAGLRRGDSPRAWRSTSSRCRWRPPCRCRRRSRATSGAAATNATCASCACSWRRSARTTARRSPNTSRAARASAGRAAATSCGSNCRKAPTRSTCIAAP